MSTLQLTWRPGSVAGILKFESMPFAIGLSYLIEFNKYHMQVPTEMQRKVYINVFDSYRVLGFIP